MKKLKIFILLCLGCQPLLGQMGPFTSTLDSSEVLIGDQVVLKLRAELDSENLFDGFDLSEWDSTEVFERLNLTDPIIEKITNGVRISQNLIFSVYDTGAFFLPLCYLRTKGLGGEDLWKGGMHPIRVFAVPVDSLHLAPIKGIIKEGFRAEDLLPYGISFLLILLLLAAYFLWKKRKSRIVVEEEIIRIHPFDKAIASLQSFRSEQYWLRGEWKAYYTGLSNILREYLENRLGIPALESTTYEIKTQLAKNPFTDALAWELVAFLQEADLVKFAKAKPSLTGDESWIAQVEQFIRSVEKKKLITEKSEEEE